MEVKRSILIALDVESGDGTAAQRNRRSFSVESSPPGLVPSVKICMLEIRDSSTSKWLSPSRNKYLRAGSEMENQTSFSIVTESVDSSL